MSGYESGNRKKARWLQTLVRQSCALKDPKIVGKKVIDPVRAAKAATIPGHAILLTMVAQQ